MSNLTPVATYDDVFQLETTTIAKAGPGGVMNAQAQALLNRTAFLFAELGTRVTTVQLADAVDDLVAKLDLADGGNVAKGAALAAYNAALAYAAGTVGGKLRQFKTFKDFGAVGDGVTDDTAAVQLAIASNADVYDDFSGAAYRLTAPIDVPNSCFTRFWGAGNTPVPKSTFFIDHNGPGFKVAAGETSFFCIDSFYCYSLPAHTAAQFIDSDGDLVHSKFTRLVLRNFKGIPLDFATLFRGEVSFLGQYCWNYMLKVTSGIASTFVFTADHSYGGGVDIGGGAHVINPYTEAICTDNDPAGANANFAEMILRGAQNAIQGGSFNLYPQNNKIPIRLMAARDQHFSAVRGFSLGAAPFWIDITATDSSLIALACPDFTYTGATVNGVIPGLNYWVAGYAGINDADVVVGGLSWRRMVPCISGTVDASTGAGSKLIGASAVSKLIPGQFRVTFPMLPDNDYHVDVSFTAGAVLTWRVVNPTTTTVDIYFNGTSSTLLADPTRFHFKITRG